jgi:hypothetical protein
MVIAFVAWYLIEELARLVQGPSARRGSAARLCGYRLGPDAERGSSWFCAGVVADGSYEVPHGLVFGFPLTTWDGKTWSIVPSCYLDEASRQRIAANVTEIQHETTAVNDVLGAI